ncbi:hypothetical protein KM043_004836 [Ampulex compressa]|nr:hypothetical protein KM043_004836 [Ampulex compressa]
MFGLVKKPRKLIRAVANDRGKARPYDEKSRGPIPGSSHGSRIGSRDVRSPNGRAHRATVPDEEGCPKPYPRPRWTPTYEGLHPPSLEVASSPRVPAEENRSVRSIEIHSARNEKGRAAIDLRQRRKLARPRGFLSILQKCIRHDARRAERGPRCILPRELAPYE